MAIVWKSFNITVPQAIVMVAGNENFMLVRQCDKPIQEIKYFGFSSRKTEITRMNDNVCIW
jgi:hypothetical protein